METGIDTVDFTHVKIKNLENNHALATLEADFRGKWLAAPPPEALQRGLSDTNATPGPEKRGKKWGSERPLATL